MANQIEKRLFIYAVNVHAGGGKVLLDEILKGTVFGPVFYLYADARYHLPEHYSSGVEFFANKFHTRLWAEMRLHWKLATCRSADAEVLFFGNLPPLIKPRARAVLYLQNCFLLAQIPLLGGVKQRLRLWAESKFLKFFYRNIDEIWVQSAWMDEMAKKHLPLAEIHIMPFLPQLATYERLAASRYQFIHVGSLAAHKRIHFFIEALRLLDRHIAKKIELCIVLDSIRIPEELKAATELRNIRVFWYSGLSRSELSAKYAQSMYFVGTSLYESFYLPMYEAHHFGCRVVMPDVPYVNEVGFAIERYDGTSPDSLAKIMKDCLEGGA